MPDFTLDDCLVRLYWRGEGGTQTVRISEPANTGVWDHEFRLDWGSHVTLRQAAAQPSVASLVAWLVAIGARRETSRSGSTSRSTALLPTLPEQGWLVQAVAAVDRAITGFIEEFADHPYLHRVEQSLHVRLFEFLAYQPELRGSWPIGSSGHFTQLVHKEWPETGPHRGTRGHFDLAVIAPNQLRDAHIDHFTGGRIEAGIAIEVGLNANRDHLPDDRSKLRANRVRAGYLIDLRRGNAADDGSLDIVLDREDPSLKTAYAHFDPYLGGTLVKLPAETAIRRLAGADLAGR